VSVLQTAVAVRHGSADDVVDVVQAVLRDAGPRVEVLPAGAPLGEASPYDIGVGAQAGGWVTIHPHYLVPPDGLAIAVTRRLGTVASATSIYEDVFWTHDLVDRGKVLDRFVNLPEYFGPGEYGREFEGDPSLVAVTLGVDEVAISPYFRQFSARRAQSRLLPAPKAHAADRFDLLDGWVITDLWRRMGISWDVDRVVGRLRVDSEVNETLAQYLRTLTG
jgi:hypothetical protein